MNNVIILASVHQWSLMLSVSSSSVIGSLCVPLVVMLKLVNSKACLHINTAVTKCFPLPVSWPATHIFSLCSSFSPSRIVLICFHGPLIPSFSTATARYTIDMAEKTV